MVLSSTRSLAVEGQAVAFLDVFPARLKKEGYSVASIEHAVAVVFDTLISLTTGTQRSDPAYKGLDQDRDNFSVYHFDDGRLTGVYSSDGDMIFVTELEFSCYTFVNERRKVA